MDKLRIHTLLCLLLLSLALSACERISPADEQTNDGEACLLLGIDTRSVTPGDGNANKGGGMNDLLVILVDNDQSNNIVRGVKRLSGLSSATRQVVSFDHVALGAYSIYAFANYDSNSLFEGTVFASLEEGDLFTAAMADASFAGLSGDGNTPDDMFRDSDGAMLLSARKDLDIKLGNNTCTVELLRPLVHFLVEVNNHSDHRMMVDRGSLSFSPFNASTSYVVAHEDMNTGTHRNMPAQSGQVEIEAHSAAVVYDCYIYENRASAYLFGMNLNMWMESLQVFAGYTISYTRNNNTYFLCNDNGTPDITTSFGSNCLWNIVPSGDYNGTYYIMSDVGSSPYLCIRRRSNSRYSVIMATAQSNNEIIKLQLPGYGDGESFSSIIGLASWNRFVYGDYYGLLSASPSSRTWQMTRVMDDGGGPGYRQIASFSGRQLYKVDALSGKALPLDEMRRNSQVKVSLNAYFNDNSGEFVYAVEAWENCSNDIEFN